MSTIESEEFSPAARTLFERCRAASIALHELEAERRKLEEIRAMTAEHFAAIDRADAALLAAAKELFEVRDAYARSLAT